VSRILATFASSHAALSAERVLLRDGLAVELIPVPRQVHSDCGFCLVTDELDPGGSAFELRRGALRASGALDLWRIETHPAGPDQRKEKTYERIP
jgi:hypothetical protein